MFKRVNYDDWQSIITIVVFLTTFAVFLYFTWRAIRMSRAKREHMANLPLEDEEKNTTRGDRHDQR